LARFSHLVGVTIASLFNTAITTKPIVLGKEEATPAEANARTVRLDTDRPRSPGRREASTTFQAMRLPFSCEQ